VCASLSFLPGDLRFVDDFGDDDVLFAGWFPHVSFMDGSMASAFVGGIHLVLDIVTEAFFVGGDKAPVTLTSSRNLLDRLSTEVAVDFSVSYTLSLLPYITVIFSCFLGWSTQHAL
jgi:hypothetical protein